jgi:hypothetical protein
LGVLLAILPGFVGFKIIHKIIYSGVAILFGPLVRCQSGMGGSAAPEAAK